MSVEKTLHGAWRVSDIVGGHFISRVFFGYSKREAVRAFVREVRKIERGAA